jgi:hypothetical protein
MQSFPIVILGGGVVAGYAAKEFVAQSGQNGGLAIVTAENALPYERPPLTKDFLAGKQGADDIQMMGKLQPFIHVPYFFSDAFDLSYEFWGDARGCDQVVYRGTLYEKKFSVWWLKKQALCASFIMNQPEEERSVAPRWILRHARLDLKALQGTRNLKSLDTTFGRLE